MTTNQQSIARGTNGKAGTWNQNGFTSANVPSKSNHVSFGHIVIMIALISLAVYFIANYVQF